MTPLDPKALEAGASDLTVELEVAVKRVTSKALLLDVDGCEYWVPKSQIVDGGTLGADAEEGDEGDMLVTKWWAADRGLD